MTNLNASAAPPRRPAAPGAAIWIAEVRVSNFRNIVDARVPLERGATFLVGENNVGKSSFLLAVATACGVRRATRDDLHRTDEEVASDATVDLIIRSEGKEFTEVVEQRLSGNLSDGPEPGEWTGIRTRLLGGRESSFLIPRRNFLTWDASTRSWLETGRTAPLPVLELLAAHLVEAARDLSVDVLSRTSDWGKSWRTSGWTLRIAKTSRQGSRTLAAHCKTQAPLSADSPRSC